MKLYKPHITILTPLYSKSSPIYLCKGLGCTGCGDDPVEAYESWLYILTPVRKGFLRVNRVLHSYLKSLEI